MLTISKMTSLMALSYAYAFLTLIAIAIGFMFRCEHRHAPLNHDSLMAWLILSLGGLMFTTMTSFFYLLNMVTIGWFLCEYVDNIY